MVVEISGGNILFNVYIKKTLLIIYNKKKIIWIQI